jgi:hypothetical protein
MLSLAPPQVMIEPIPAPAFTGTYLSINLYSSVRDYSPVDNTDFRSNLIPGPMVVDR